MSRELDALYSALEAGLTVIIPAESPMAAGLLASRPSPAAATGGGFDEQESAIKAWRKVQATDIPRAQLDAIETELRAAFAAGQAAPRSKP